MPTTLWLIPLFPLVGALVNMCFGRITGRHAHWIGVPALVGSFIASCMVFSRIAAGESFTATLFSWVGAGDFATSVTAYVDPLTGVMLLVVTGVGMLIHLYSIGYMHDDPGYPRYFAYLNLFVFSMTMLVLAGNFLLLYVFWEAVGLCSYLLIGFWYTRPAASQAGKKAFIVNRVGDFGFGLGIMWLWTAVGTLDYDSAFAAVGRLEPSTATGIALLLFMGACGKSAQLPLHTWLPDAMEGPTPVSALIHAATMVTAGVYMVARSRAIFEQSPVALEVVAWIGVATALFAATIGLVQTDIKRVLAYSTVSQLGYMFLAVGCGAYAAGMFHLVTHAFFKACLFLGAGSVIHGLSGEQDMFKMGALSKHMKITWATFLISSLAIAGIPPLAGFFSKDEILWQAFTANLQPVWLGRVLWVVALAAAWMTAFYVFRAVFLTFHGTDRVSHEAKHHLHESPPAMTVPLVLLAAGAVLVGFLAVPVSLGGGNAFHHWLEPVFAGHIGTSAVGVGMETPHPATVAAEAGGNTSLEIILMLLSVAVAATGILTARLFYLRSPGLPAAVSARLGGFYTLVANKYYIDELYERTIVRPGYALADGLMFRVIDAGVIEGIVNGLGIAARLVGAVTRLVQSGVVRTYAFFMLIGFLYLVYQLVR